MSTTQQVLQHQSMTGWLRADAGPSHSMQQPASSSKCPFSSEVTAVGEPAANATLTSSSKCPFSNEQSAVQEAHAAPAAVTGVQGPLGLSVSFPPRDYLPFKDEAYKIDLQFDRIAANDVFEIDEHYEEDMQRKGHILATRPAELLYPAVPGVSP